MGGAKHMLGPKKRVILGKKLTSKGDRIESYVGMIGFMIQNLDIECRH